MEKTLAEIAEIVKGEVIGDKKLIITGFSGIKEAKQGDLTFAASAKYAPLLRTTKASAVLISYDLPRPRIPAIRAHNPSLAFSMIVSRAVLDAVPPPQGIHPTAVIAPDAALGTGVVLGPYVVVESGVVIKEGTVIHAGCYIGARTVIGAGCLIYPSVTVRERAEIGDRVIIHSGAVIGSDGFGFEQMEGRHVKIPQLGIVVIGDDVEIGANVTIDRARFDKTIIGKGTKIDNLVQVAHNVIIGEDCIIIAQAGLAGSVTLGKGTIVAGQVGITGHLTIGEGAIIASRAGVIKSVPPFSKVSGFPAKPHEQAKRINACIQRLPLYVKTILELKEKVERLEGLLISRKDKHDQSAKND